MLITIGLLSACGSNELSGFVESYNENAYEFVSVSLLDEDDFGEIREEKYGNWQRLFEREDHYYIEAKYDGDNELTGYHIHVTGEEPYERHEGEGYESALVIGETLGINRDKFIETYEKTLVEDPETVEYKDGNYSISIDNFSVGQTIINDGMTINFDKTSQ